MWGRAIGSLLTPPNFHFTSVSPSKSGNTLAAISKSNNDQLSNHEPPVLQFCATRDEGLPAVVPYIRAPFLFIHLSYTYSSTSSRFLRAISAT